VPQYPCLLILASGCFFFWRGHLTQTLPKSLTTSYPIHTACMLTPSQVSMVGIHISVRIYRVNTHHCDAARCCSRISCGFQQSCMQHNTASQTALILNVDTAQTIAKGFPQSFSPKPNGTGNKPTPSCRLMPLSHSFMFYIPSFFAGGVIYKHIQLKWA
jgi:hypothetical protein